MQLARRAEEVVTKEKLKSLLLDILMNHDITHLMAFYLGPGYYVPLLSNLKAHDGHENLCITLQARCMFVISIA
jgi:hypothetical protein